MRKLKFILVISIMMSGQSMLACDCDFQGDFLKVAPKTDFVALIKVVRYLTFKKIYDKPTPMSMEVEIIQVYQGKEKRKTLTIWGDNGFLCRPYLSQFAEGSYYIIAFYKMPNGSDLNKKTTDYFISICGDYWLKADMKKQIAIGSVTEKQFKMKFSDIKKSFEKMRANKKVTNLVT